MPAIRTAIIEDHENFRDGLTHLLKFTDGFECSGSYSTAEEGLRELRQADIVLLDIHLPGRSGIDTIPPLREKLPAARIVMLTVFDDDEHIFRAIMAGADGYVLKKTPPAEILTAIRDAASGGTPMSPYVARRVIELFRKYAPSGHEDHQLTSREVDVLNHLVQGFDTEEISKRLYISRETVRNHIKHIYEKLHVHSRSQAVVKAIREGLV
jgi:DNA-binding NarL/FixJ family response regulator